MKLVGLHFHCFFLFLAVMLVCSSCANPRLATTIALTRTQGEVEIIDRRGKDVSLKENLRIFDGYIMGTHTSSYAWMDLDQARLVKLNQDSQIGIQKEKKKLEIVVQSGSLFFHVARPLEEDESLDIRTSSMMVASGVRAAGWKFPQTGRLCGCISWKAGWNAVLERVRKWQRLRQARWQV